MIFGIRQKLKKTSDFIAILKEQREYFYSGETKSIDFRIAALKKLATIISENEKLLLDSLYADLKRSEFEGYALDIGPVLTELKSNIKALRRWAKPKRVGTPFFLYFGHSKIQYEPLGVTLIIAPWNYPILLALAPLISAVAAGNCVIVKPSELSPNCSSAIAEIIGKTFSQKHVAVVEGGPEISESLLENQFDYVFYTGSTETGKKVYVAAAKHLTPVTLELGGKSPCIIDKETDLETSARRIVWGKFINAGQTCIAPDYLLVDKSIRNILLDKIMDQIKIFYGDDPVKSPDYGRIINRRHFERLSSLFNQGEIVLGGKTDANQLYISPSIIDKVEEHFTIMKDEIFGPILPVLEYENIREAIRIINSKPKPLALYIFSKNKNLVEKVLAETSSGGACVNETIMHIANPNLPFGGVGASGIGNYHGEFGFKTFSHQRSVLYKSFFADIKIRYAPYSEKSLNWIKRLIG